MLVLVATLLGSGRPVTNPRVLRSIIIISGYSFSLVSFNLLSVSIRYFGLSHVYAFAASCFISCVTPRIIESNME